MNFTNWLAPVLAERQADALADIAANPVSLTVRRDGADHGPYTVRLIRAGREVLTAQTPDSAAPHAPYTILAPAGTDLATGDRCKAATVPPLTMRVTYVDPDRRWFVRADAIVEV